MAKYCPENIPAEHAGLPRAGYGRLPQREVRTYNELLHSDQSLMPTNGPTTPSSKTEFMRGIAILRDLKTDKKDRTIEGLKENLKGYTNPLMVQLKRMADDPEGFHAEASLKKNTFCPPEKKMTFQTPEEVAAAAEERKRKAESLASAANRALMVINSGITGMEIDTTSVNAAVFEAFESAREEAADAQMHAVQAMHIKPVDIPQPAIDEMMRRRAAAPVEAMHVHEPAPMQVYEPAAMQVEQPRAQPQVQRAQPRAQHQPVQPQRVQPVQPQAQPMQVDAIVPADCGEAAISAFWAWLGAAGDAPIPPEHIPAFRTLFTKLNMYCNRSDANSNLWETLGFDNDTAIQVLKHAIMQGPGCYANASGFEDVDEIAMLQMEAADFDYDGRRPRTVARVPCNAECAGWIGMR